MRVRWLLPLLLPAGLGEAGGFEIDLHVGRAMPTFEQQLSYDPSTEIPPGLGISLRPAGPLVLDAKGGLAFAGSATWFFAGAFGIEARLDGLDADLETQGTSYDVVSSLPGVNVRLDVEGRGLQLERVMPISLNLRVLTPGPVKVSISGGVSKLGTLRLAGSLAGTLRGSVGPVPLPGVGAQVSLKAEAPPADADKDRYGVNAGLGLQVALGQHVALSLEARGFLFRDRTLTWTSAAPPSNALEQALEQELLARLDPIEFTPTFFSVNAGLALRF